MTTRSYDMYAVKRNLKSPTLGHWTLPYYPMDWQRMNKRRVWQTESSDFIHWSDFVWLEYPGAPPEHLYTNQTTPYFRAAHIYIGLAARFMPGRGPLTRVGVRRVVPQLYADRAVTCQSPPELPSGWIGCPGPEWQRIRAMHCSTRGYVIVSSQIVGPPGSGIAAFS